MGNDRQSADLKRVIGFWGITFYGLGGIIGAGIFATIGAITARAGVYAPLAFVIAGIPALFAALSYGQLVKRLPKAGGEAAYVFAAFKSKTLMRIVALGVALSGSVSAATLLSAFAGYFQAVAISPAWMVKGVLGLVSVALAVGGVSMSTGVVIFITLIEVGLLLLIFGAGAGEAISYPGWMLAATPPEGLVFSLGASAVLAFFAFIGFEDVVNMAEEVKDAPKVLPRALILAFVVSLVLYLGVCAVAVMSVPIEELGASDEPLADVARSQGILPPAVMTAMALASIGNGVIIQINMVSRLLYGLAKDGGAPQLFSKVWSQTGTPAFSVLLCGAAVYGFAVLLPLEQLAELTGVIVLAVFAFVQLALIQLIRKEGAGAGSRMRSYLIPIAGFLSSIVLMFGALV